MAFPHPGMATHPGMPPGQHMGPLGPHATGPPMGHMQAQGMPPQMHPGMPGQNHVSQAGQMMGGIPHGMNPNPNAMAHLQTAPQMFPNQQMQHMNQQHMMAQQQQQEQLARSKALMSQGRQNPMGAMLQPGQSMNPQQLQQLQQQQHQLRMNIPNMQHNQMMAQMMQQQQQQGGGPGGPPQRQAGPPGGPAPQMRVPPQMQGMHVPHPGPNGQQGGPGPAPQMRPQTSNQCMQGPQVQTPQPQQAQQTPQRPSMPGRQPTNHSSPPQSAQQNQSTPHSQPQQDHPVSASGQPPSIAGAQEAQNRTPQQQQQNQMQQQQMPQQQGQNPNNEMTKQMMQGPINNQMARAALARHNNQMSQVHDLVGQGAKVRLVLFAEQLSGFNAERNMAPPIEQLQSVISDYFVENGTFRLRMQAQQPQEAEYAIPTSTLARFFLTHYESGVQNIQLSVSRANAVDAVNGSQFIECQQASFTYTFGNNQFIRSKGKVRATLNSQHRFENFEFESIGFDEFIASTALRQMLSANSPENQHKSPNMTKSKLPAKQKGKPAPPRSTVITENDIPANPVRPDGFTEATFRFMEVASVFTQMQGLLDYAQQHKLNNGTAALNKYNEAAQNGQLPIQQPQMGPSFPGAQAVAAAAAAQGNPYAQFATGAAPNGITQGPNMGGMRQQPGMNSQFTSPAANHLGLPNTMNSPHMRQGGSPGQAGIPPHMQGGVMAPQMVAQHSMQGTNSGAPSSNASPNAPNKKRRASVKLDGSNDPGGAPMVNGVTPNPKATPKMGNQQKRPRAN